MKRTLISLSSAAVLVLCASRLPAQQSPTASPSQPPPQPSAAQTASPAAAPQAPAPMAMPQGNLTAWPQGMLPAQQMQMQPMQGMGGGGCMGGQGMGGMSMGGGGCMGGMMGGQGMGMSGGTMPMAMNQGMTIQNLVQLVTLQEIFDILDELASLEEEAIAGAAGPSREKLAKKLAGIKEQIAELRRENRAQITNGSAGR